MKNKELERDRDRDRDKARIINKSKSIKDKKHLSSPRITLTKKPQNIQQFAFKLELKSIKFILFIFFIFFFN